MFMKHYAPNRCEPRIEVNVKIHPPSKEKPGGLNIFYCIFGEGVGLQVLSTLVTARLGGGGGGVVM